MIAKTLTRVILILFFLLSGTMAQDRLNPPYPRTASYSLGQSQWPTYSMGTRLKTLSRYDMAYIYGSTDDHGTTKAQALRAINPNQILIAMGLNGVFFSDPPEYYLYRSYRGHLLSDISPGQKQIPVDNIEGVDKGLSDLRFCFVVINNDVIDITGKQDSLLLTYRDDPNDFYAVSDYHSAGDSVLSVLRLSGPGIFPNFSQWARPVNDKYIWDYLAEKNLLDKIEWDLSLYDGLFHDAFYGDVYLQWHSMDMNLNGVDDYEEFGSTPQKANQYFINPHRREYIELWLDKEIDLMGQLTPDQPNMLGVNNGGTCEYFYDELNGHCYEGFLRWANWYYLKDDCIKWRQENESRNRPSMMFIEDYIPEKWSHNGKDRFTKMRFGLTTALLFDCYYGMTFGDWYYIMLWYDEFETNLGYGLSDAFELANGLWVRYFQHGVAVCNPTGQEQTLNPSDLDGRTYHRLRGGQDPEVNNGQIFDEPIQIYGHTYGDSDKRGDGIIMFTEPTTSVTDIIVDNFYHNDTSPGSNPVELAGSWGRYVSKGYVDLSKNNPYWSQFGNKQQVGDFDDAYGYHAVSGGDGSDQAVWRPTIGVAGYYEIAEWHGWHGDTQSSFQEASNVPFEIVIDNETKIRGIIDQTKNYGQWNVLGYGYLPKGLSNYVKITNDADGYVIADAIRFRYLGEIDPDTTPPDPPSNVRIIE